MDPRNYFNFIIKYQLGLAIDFQQTVNNTEYKETIDNYFELIDENSKLKQKIMFNEFIEKYQDKQIKQKQSYDGFIKDYADKQKRIYDHEDKKSTKYLTNPHYLDEKINDSNRSLALLSGGDIPEKYEIIKIMFSKIYEDITKTGVDYKYEFFKEDTLEYKNVETFINSIKENNEMVVNELTNILKIPGYDINKYQSTTTYLITLISFNSFVAKFSFHLPTLIPDSNIYKKILNYIYLCIVLFDEKIFKPSHENLFINCNFNNSIVPYGCEINEHNDLIMDVFQGSCAHIASLLSIALEEENDQLLRDFASKELSTSLGKYIKVDDISIHLLLTLSELLLNKGNLNFYNSIEYITYNKLQNEIIFYRSFSNHDIQELLEKKEYLLRSSKHLMLIGTNPVRYDMDYTNKYYGRYSATEMKLYRETNFNDDEFVVRFYNAKMNIFSSLTPKEKQTDKTIKFTESIKELPCYVFNFAENFIFHFNRHAVLMHTKDFIKGEYEIIDPNSTFYKKGPTFNIKKIYRHSKIIYKTDELFLKNLEYVIKRNYPKLSINDFINTNDYFKITPMTLFYGQLKNDLTPIRFSLNMGYIIPKPKPDLINDYNVIFYIGNGIWLDKNGVCLFLINDELTPIYTENGTTSSQLTFDQLVLSDYILIFNNAEIREITLNYISLSSKSDPKTSRGLQQNYYNLTKYLILILIFITVIIIVAIIIKLIVNKNKTINNQITSE